MQNPKMKMRERGDWKSAWCYRTLLLSLALIAPSQAGAQAIDPNDQVPPPQLAAGFYLKLLDRDGEPEKRRLKIMLRDGAITTPAPGDAGDPTLDGAWLIVKNGSKYLARSTTARQKSLPSAACLPMPGSICCSNMPRRSEIRSKRYSWCMASRAALPP